MSEAVTAAPKSKVGRSKKALTEVEEKSEPKMAANKKGASKRKAAPAKKEEVEDKPEVEENGKVEEEAAAASPTQPKKGKKAPAKSKVPNGDKNEEDADGGEEAPAPKRGSRVRKEVVYKEVDEDVDKKKKSSRAAAAKTAEPPKKDTKAGNKKKAEEPAKTDKKAGGGKKKKTVEEPVEEDEEDVETAEEAEEITEEDEDEKAAPAAAKKGRGKEDDKSEKVAAASRKRGGKKATEEVVAVTAVITEKEPPSKRRGRKRAGSIADENETNKAAKEIPVKKSKATTSKRVKKEDKEETKSGEINNERVDSDLQKRKTRFGSQKNAETPKSHGTKNVVSVTKNNEISKPKEEAKKKPDRKIKELNLQKTETSGIQNGVVQTKELVRTNHGIEVVVSTTKNHQILEKCEESLKINIKAVDLYENETADRSQKSTQQINEPMKRSCGTISVVSTSKSIKATRKEKNDNKPTELLDPNLLQTDTQNGTTHIITVDHSNIEIELGNEAKAKNVENAKILQRTNVNIERGGKKQKLEKPIMLNQIDTNYSNINLELENKNHNLKISSWNVAGIRAWEKKGGLEFLEHENPDILCLQETKCLEDDMPTVGITGYLPYYLCKTSGYAGVAIYSKKMPMSVLYGIGNDVFDADGRVLTAEYEKFYLVCAYVPNSGRGLVNLSKRMEWDKLFLEFLDKLDKKKPVILCGDLNVSHLEIDLANPKTNRKNAGFTQEERDGMSRLLSDKYVDTFRYFYPDKIGCYTFWTYMGGARKKNVGWRLDYFIVSKTLLNKVVDNVIRSQIFGSDHCPITLFLNI